MTEVFEYLKLFHSTSTMGEIENWFFNRRRPNERKKLLKTETSISCDGKTKAGAENIY